MSKTECVTAYCFSELYYLIPTMGCVTAYCFCQLFCLISKQEVSRLIVFVSLVNAVEGIGLLKITLKMRLMVDVFDKAYNT